MTWARCSRSVPCLGCVCSPIVIEPWLLLAYQWMGWPEVWLAVRIGDNHSVQAASGGWPHGVGFTPAGSGSFQDLPLVMPLVELTGYGLKPATMCIGSGPSWEGPQCRSMSDAAYDQPVTTCLELQSDLWLVAASAAPECSWEGPHYEPRPAATSLGPGAGQ